MPIATPTPYKNLALDIENEEANAAALEEGVNDAKARFEAAAKQYHANPTIPAEQIYNKAQQDLLERMNRRDRVKSKAKELEIQAKPSPSRAPSSMDLSSLANLFSPQAEAATVASTSGGPEFHPPMQMPTQPAQKMAGNIRALRAAGVGSVGDKATIEEKNRAKITETKPYLIDQGDVDTIGGAFRSTPEWQRQEQGLNDLENLIGLEAERNAKKTSVDLSPLGAYLDYQNTLSGKPTNLAAALKGQPIEESSLKDMGEIQRRRADMAKELINTIKAAKVGQVVTNADGSVTYTSGVVPPRPSSPTGQANLHFRELSALRKYTDSSFKEPEHQLSAINNMISRIQSENPSYIGALPAKLEQMDTGNQRVLLGLIGMETYDNSAPARLTQYLKTLTKGTLTEHTKALLIDRLNRSAEDTKLKMQAAEDDVRDFAGTLKSLRSDDVEGVVGSKVRSTAKAYPRAMKAGNPPEKFTEGKQAPATSVDDLWEKRKARK